MFLQKTFQSVRNKNKLDELHKNTNIKLYRI